MTKKILAYSFILSHIILKNTKDENKEKVEFPYTHEGVDQCIDWLNQKYIDDKDKWDEAFNSRMNAE